ncbi:hypothetical protein SAMN06265370_10245 [Puniceibacterium sediminis]|uniref:Uncharacterized protein n=1 Tax=Puniceibacterium sediminis TaxID=1608407 RepID=A0A238VF73_9RHOB|nr:hypothetical protein SAMN06265370_10245 [Puniceibacterium sediminis]
MHRHSDRQRLGIGLLSTPPGAEAPRRVTPPRLVSVRLIETLRRFFQRRKPMAKLGWVWARSR